MAHAWWHRTVPAYGTEEFYDQPGPDVAAAMDWAKIQAEKEGRKPTWKDILRYWTTKDPTASPAGMASAYQAQEEEELVGRAGVSREEAAYAGLPDVPPGSKDYTSSAATEKLLGRPLLKKEKEKDKADDFLNKLFLMSMMENMQGGDIGQAPAVVAGSGRREFPTMMRQFAPWEREKPYWWMR